MLWQKLRISIFLNGCTHEEWETASAFHKNLSVFLELHLLYRTRSSMSSNRPVSYFRQLLLLRHREFESFPFTFETLMLIMHTYTLNWSQLDGHDFKSICLFMYVAFNQWKFDTRPMGIAWVASWGPWHVTKTEVYSCGDSHESGNSVSFQDFLNNVA